MKNPPAHPGAAVSDKRSRSNVLEPADGLRTLDARVADSTQPQTELPTEEAPSARGWKLRAATYVILSLLLPAGAFVLEGSRWQGNTQLHTLNESASTFLALFAGLIALTRHYSRKSDLYLYLGTAFLGAGLLDGYHTVATSSFFDSLSPSPPASLIPWSWLASRIYLPAFLCLTFFISARNNGDCGHGNKRELLIYGGGLASTLVCLSVLVLTPLPRAYYPELSPHRPQELVPAVLFLAAFGGFLKRRAWRADAFEHSLVVFLLMGFIVEVAFMAWSSRLFDAMFDAAHVLKAFSYGIVLMGLMVTMSRLFRQADHTTQTTRRANQALKEEVHERQKRTAQMQRLAAATAAVNSVKSIEEIVQLVSEEARQIIGAHQAMTIFVEDRNWSHSIHGLSLSERYAAYPSYDARPEGSGIYAMVCETNQPVRMTQQELEAHPRWRGFGGEAHRHPPMRGWLAAPLIGPQGENLGLLQLSDKYEGDFNDNDEAVLVQLAQAASAALEIRNANLFLEAHVEERTAALSKANSGLQAEIKERKQVEEQLRESEQRLQLALDAAHAGVWTWDLTSNEVVWDESMERIFGIRTDSFGETFEAFAELVHPDDLPTTQEAIDKALEGGPQYDTVYRVRGNGGTWRRIRMQGVVHRDGQKRATGMTGICIDVTETFEARERLQRANKELDDFAYIASHDLRSPLRAIDSLAQWIAEDVADALPEKSRKHLTLMQQRVQRMETLLDDILQYSRAGRLEYKTEQIDTNSLVQKVIDLLSPPEGFDVRIQDEMPIISSKQPPLQQVFLNLIGNAVKHHDRRDGRVEVSSQDRGMFVEFLVADDGPGVPAQFRDKIFQMFKTLKPRDQVEGSGVGLAVVKKLIESEGGRISVQSPNGRGTCFRFTWPKDVGQTDS